MKHRVCSVAVLALTTFALAGTVRAGFTLNATKVDAGDKDIVSLYFFNDGTNNTGTTLEAYDLTYNGAPTSFFWDPGDPDSVDLYNTANDPTKSWVKINPTFHMPFQVSPSLTDVAWKSPVGSFQIVYAKLNSGNGTANTGLGLQFAKIVIDDGDSFTLKGQVGGNTGGAQLANFDYAYFIANLPPTISGDGSVNSLAAPAGASGSLSTRRITAADADGVIKAFSLADLNNAVNAGFGVTKVDATTYDLTWDPSKVRPGTYNFGLSATDSSVQSNRTTTSTLAITVVPEPATLGLMGAALLAGLRRRR